MSNETNYVPNPRVTPLRFFLSRGYGSLKSTGGTVSGSIDLTNNITNHVKAPFLWATFADSSTLTQPALAELYHEIQGGAGGGVANTGVSLDLRADSTSLDRQLQLRLSSFWTDAAAQTSHARFFTVLAGTSTECLRLSNAGLDMRNGTVLQVNGTQVVTARDTGWVTFTGTANKNAGALDTGTATTAQVAQVVKSIMDVLIQHGLIGT